MKIYLFGVAASLGAAVLISSACELQDKAQRSTPIHVSLFQ